MPAGLNLDNSLLLRVPRDYWNRMQSSHLGRRLAHGAFWSLTGAFAARFLTMAASVVVARRLGKQGFGEYGIIQSTFSMFSIFGGFGLGLTATKFVAEFRQKDPDKAGRIIGLSAFVAGVSGSVLACALLLLAPVLAAKTLAAPQLVGELRIAALLVLLTALNTAQTGALAGLEAFKAIAKVNLYTGLVTLPLVAGGVVLLGLEGAFWGLAVSAGFTWLFNHIALRREAAKLGIGIAFRGCSAERRVLWTFSLPAVLSGLLAAPANWVCNALLVNQPHGYAQMGILNAANQWFFALLFLPGVIAKYTVPVLSERLGSKDKSACSKILKYSIGLNAALVFPLVLVGCLGSRYVMAIYGDGFAEHRDVLIVAMITAGVLAIGLPMAQMMAASGRMWTEMCMNLGWALAFCFGTLLSLSQGALGLVSARLIAYVLLQVWIVGFVIRLLRQPRFTKSLPPCVATE